MQDCAPNFSFCTACLKTVLSFDSSWPVNTALIESQRSSFEVHVLNFHSPILLSRPVLTPPLRLPWHTVLFRIYQATVKMLNSQVAPHRLLAAAVQLRDKRARVMSKGRQYELTSNFIAGAINNTVFTVWIKKKAHTGDVNK